MSRQEAAETAINVLVQARRDQVRILAFRDNAAEIINLDKVRFVFRVEFRGNECCPVQMNIPRSFPDDYFAPTRTGDCRTAARPACRVGGKRPRIMSDAFSAIINTAADVLADGTVGMTEASATRSPSSPWTCS